jgi:betaine reductase
MWVYVHFALKAMMHKKYSKKGDMYMAILKDKKAIIIGDRDGIPGQAISECAGSAGAEVVFSSTECFV